MTARARNPALLPLAVSLFSAVSLVPLRAAQDVDVYERLANYATFFEPETAAFLGLSPERGRVTDLSEEGLAARARGFERIRAGLRGPPLFPNMPEDLAGAVDARRFLDRRVAGFRRVRAWARSPLCYVRAVAAALASVELDPGLEEAERRQALTERARQLPYVLSAASAALVNPPRFLSRQALAEGPTLRQWIAALAFRTASLPEGGEKWALAQALEAADESLQAFLERTEADLPSANGAPGLGEDVVSEIAVSYGFDGALHVLEILNAATAALEAEPSRAPSPAAPDSMSAGPSPPVSLSAAVAARWPGAGRPPAVSISYGPAVVHRGGVAVAWRPGASASSGGLARVHVARERAGDGAALASRVVSEAAPAAWLLPAAGMPSGSGNAAWARTRLLVAWDGLEAAVRWFARATAAGGALLPPEERRAALTEAAAARSALLVHLGRLDVPGALDRLPKTGAHSADASRWLAGNLSDPSGIVAPALGFVLWRRWRDSGRAPPAAALAEWLRAG